jgi:hypothetical protein
VCDTAEQMFPSGDDEDERLSHVLDLHVSLPLGRPGTRKQDEAVPPNVIYAEEMESV